jgi:hypothetical protein
LLAATLSPALLLAQRTRPIADSVFFRLAAAAAREMIDSSSGSAWNDLPWVFAMPAGTRGAAWESLARDLRALRKLRDTTADVNERRVYFEIGNPKLLSDSGTYEFEVLIRHVIPCRDRTLTINGTRQMFRIGGPEGWSAPRRHISVEFDSLSCSKLL